MLPRECHACGSEACTFLGALGHTRHYRCRACGMISSVTRKPAMRRPPEELQRPLRRETTFGIDHFLQEKP